MGCLIFCGVDCKKQPSTHYVLESFKQWSLFQKGSYWIYYNETTNSIDSTYIDHNPDIWYTPGVPANYEIINLGLSNSFINSYSIMAGDQDNSFLRIGLSYPDIDPEVLSKWVTDRISDKISTYCNLINVYPTISINGNNFTNVLQTRDSNYFDDGTKSIKTYFFAKNIGLIKLDKKIGKTDTIWSLLRWHAVQ